MKNIYLKENLKYFDFEKFRELLTNTLKRAFIKLKNSLKGDDIYLYSVLTTHYFDYFYVSVNTKKLFDAYCNKDQRSKLNPDDIKWSSYDGASMEISPDDKIFEEINELVGDWMCEIQDYDMFEYRNYHKIMDDICLEVIISLDKQNFFKIKDRKKVVLGYFKGDQTNEEVLEYISLLNPKESYELFEKAIKSYEN